MSEQYTHNCIKCQTQYKDSDPEAYYCTPCNEERLRIAKEVDAKFATRPKKQARSSFGIAQTMGKTINSAAGGQATFVKAGDLGINFN